MQRENRLFRGEGGILGPAGKPQKWKLFAYLQTGWVDAIKWSALLKVGCGAVRITTLISCFLICLIFRYRPNDGVNSVCWFCVLFWSHPCLGELKLHFHGNLLWHEYQMKVSAFGHPINELLRPNWVCIVSNISNIKYCFPRSYFLLLWSLRLSENDLYASSPILSYIKMTKRQSQVGSCESAGENISVSGLECIFIEHTVKYLIAQNSQCWASVSQNHVSFAFLCRNSPLLCKIGKCLKSLDGRKMSLPRFSSCLIYCNCTNVSACGGY